MMDAALINVDIQKTFCLDGELAVPGGDEVVEPVNKVTNVMRQRGAFVFFTGDCHPEDSEHFKQWGAHGVRGTNGAWFHPKLDIDGGIVIYKGTKRYQNAYSAFEETALLQLLRRLGITKVYITGLATDYCVKATALDARKYGFETYLLLNACRAVNLKPDDEKNAIEEMRKAGVIITTTDEVMQGNI